MDNSERPQSRRPRFLKGNYKDQTSKSGNSSQPKGGLDNNLKTKENQSSFTPKRPLPKKRSLNVLASRSDISKAPVAKNNADTKPTHTNKSQPNHPKRMPKHYKPQDKKEIVKPLSDLQVPIPAADDFLFLPLGGSGEIGMNVNLYGTNKQWIMVDLGISFGDDDNGIDFVTANLEFIKRSSISKHLKGVIITHAHEDHIGGVHEIWPHFKFHIYMTKFAKEVLLNKLEGKLYKDELVQYYLHEIPHDGTFSVGDFDVQFLELTHSIPESNGLLIKTKLGTIFHTGDWKVDTGPILGEPIDPQKLGKLANQKIMAMICDSTNSILPGHSGSEKEVYDALQTLIGKIKKGRIIASCFASNLARIKGLADAAFANGREVCLLGRSIDRMTAAAEKCNYPLHLEQFVSEDEARRLPPHKIMYIATGTQGDEKAALARIARGVHRSVQLSDGDTVIMSSKIIPGNERRVNIMFNDLARNGVRIITEKQEKVHVSGHPYQGDLKKMYEWVQPEYVIPVHGEMLHLVEHARFARSCGFKTLIPENGMLISLVRKKTLRSYDIGRWGFDGNRFISMMSSLIKERQIMGTQGCIFATITLNKHKNKVVPDQTIISMTGLDDDSEVLTERIKTSLTNMFNKVSSADGDTGRLQPEAVRTPKTKERISNVVRSALNKVPLVVIHWLYC